MIVKSVRTSFFALLLTVLVIVSLVWFVLDSYLFMETTDRRFTRMIELSGDLTYLDEVLTMSARMASATADLKWESRFRKYETELDSVLKEMFILGKQFGLNAAVIRTEAANSALVDLENQAFHLIRAGDQGEASLIFIGPEYSYHKNEFKIGIDQITTSLNQILQQQIHHQKKLGYFSLLFAVIIIPILVIVWTFTLRREQHNQDSIYRINQELQSSNASKDKLFSIIAHDLKSPFLGLLGLSEILVDQRETLSPEKSDHINKMIHASLLHQYHLLVNLLEWSRLQQGNIAFNPVPVNINELLREITDQFQINLSKKGIRLSEQYSKDEDMVITADTDLIRSAFQNILSNAIKFTPQDGMITICTDGSGGIAMIKITDSGIGISPERVETIFHPDAVQSTAGTEGEKGTGLGLMLCKEFIEKHGGTLKITSEVGKGTMVIMRLPTCPST